MIKYKSGLRFAFSILLLLSFSMVWAAGTGGGSVSGGTGSSGMSMSSTLSNPANRTAIQKADTPSEAFYKSQATEVPGDSATKQQEKDTKKQDAPEKDAKKQNEFDKQDQAAEKDESVFQSEFQNFVAQSVGHTLPMYGYNLFHRAPSTFAPVDNIPVTPDYTIGPGDELVVHVWGQVEANQSVVVDRNGLINLPKIGSISVAGVRYQKITEHIGDAIGRMFSNFEIDVSMGKLRSIQVFVVGQAARPGSFTVSSLSTLVNTLFVSGGPSAKGSMRHIQLKRGNKVISDFDLYDLLLKGDKSKDVKLLPGDVIYIPPIGPMAAISGSVNNQAIFELKGKENLSDLLGLAGGLTNVAAGQKVSVERIHEHEMRKVDEFQLDQNGLAKPMRDGDVVTVFSISPRFDNAVKLQGNVAAPMRYIWKEGMRITDLLNDKNSVIPGAYWARQNSGALNNSYNKKEVNWDYAVVQRLDGEKLTTKLVAFKLGKAIEGDPAENMLLQPGDVVTIFSAEEALPKTENDIVLKGSIFSPSNRRFVWREGMRVNDLIPSAKWLTDYYDYWSNLRGDKLSSGINWGYANVVRLQHRDLTRTMLTFDLGKAVLGNDSTHNLVLLPGDEVSIFTNNEIQVSGEKEVKYITLEGEVKTPGIYPVGRGETLRQLVARLGGVTPRSYLRGSIFTRESVREFQQKNLNEVIDKMEVELRSAESEASSSAMIRPEDAAVVKGKIAKQYAILASMRNIKAAGRIVLELPEEGAQIKDLPDIAPEDGDRFTVPSTPSTVSVFGAVYNQSTFLHKHGKVVDDYLEKAGGATRDGDAENIYVVLADGTVKANRSSTFFGGGLNGRELKPGDLVFVPQKIDVGYFSLTKAIMDWSQILYQMALTVAGGKAAGMW